MYSGPLIRPRGDRCVNEMWVGNQTVSKRRKLARKRFLVVIDELRTFGNIGCVRNVRMKTARRSACKTKTAQKPLVGLRTHLLDEARHIEVAL